MSTITILPVSPLDLSKVREAIAANLSRAIPKTTKRRPSVWKLAVGYRLMAWRSLRKGDGVSAAMHAACSRALRGELG
jgi:hypothetical protein